MKIRFGHLITFFLISLSRKPNLPIIKPCCTVYFSACNFAFVFSAENKLTSNIMFIFQAWFWRSHRLFRSLNNTYCIHKSHILNHLLINLCCFYSIYNFIRTKNHQLQVIRSEVFRKSQADFSDKTCLFDITWHWQLTSLVRFSSFS